MKKFLIPAILIMIQSIARPDEGMWIPLFLGELNEAEMKSMGMKLSAEEIFSLNESSLKDAIVIFGGGCTGEVVSGQGLILTNHHCGYGRIQRHSSLEHDYLTEGFWAMSREEELPNPGLTVTFLIRMEEVTDRVLVDVEPTMTEKQRKEQIDKNIAVLEKEAVEGTHYKSVVKPFFYGNRYFLFVNEVFEDVRLVGAPPSSIGKFGGDTDNWVWPRHTGDFSVFRIYAGKDNLPAPYSEENVPYTPKRHLAISLCGVRQGDFTMVFGYPGSTEQYIPSWAVDMQANLLNPVRIGLRGQRLAIFKKYMEQSHEIRLQYAAKESAISNGWKKWIGENRGIRRLKTLEAKQQFEAQFTGWVNSNPATQSRYEGLLDALKRVYQELGEAAFQSTWLRESVFSVEAIRYASSFSQLVEGSRQKKPEMTGLLEILQRLKGNVDGYFRDYQQAIDREVFVAMVAGYYNHPGARIPDYLQKLYQKSDGDFEEIAGILYGKSMFADRERISSFLEGYKASDYKKIENDPFYKLWSELNALHSAEYLPAIRTLSVKTDSLMRVYMQAQIEMQPYRKFYPDANFTLRVAYGNVLGYSPDDALSYRYFTTLEGILEKEDPDVFDYQVADRLIDLHSVRDYGKYADADGNLHVCFTTSNHTTGGNSGSPVLDANGYLVGINFDRCWEGTMSDIHYDITQCRNIALDIRYCLFIMDKFAGAGHLVDEMTLVESDVLRLDVN